MTKKEMESICRTCLRCSEILLPLFDETQLPRKIETISGITILKTDRLPTKICAECVININLSYNFRRIIINSNLELRQRLLPLVNQNKLIFETCQANKLEFVRINVKTEIDEHPKVEKHNETFQDIKGEYIETKMETIIIKQAEKENDTGTQITDVRKLIKIPKDTRKTVTSFRSKNKLYKCKLCDFTTGEYAKHKRHTRNHFTKKSMCNVCGKTIRTDNLKKHISIHTDPPVACQECGRVCKNSESLRAHVLIHKGLQITCEFCGQIYKYRGGYKRHVQKQHLGSLRKNKCNLCEKSFHEKTDLKKHIRSHTGERPYPCQYCKKGFSSSYALKTHVRQHTNEKPYTCSFCPMAFPQKVSLRTHLRSKHSTPV